MWATLRGLGYVLDWECEPYTDLNDSEYAIIITDYYIPKRKNKLSIVFTEGLSTVHDVANKCDVYLIHDYNELFDILLYICKFGVVEYIDEMVMCDEGS
jgi:hypothetical protein